jgi:hypothetical protein
LLPVKVQLAPSILDWIDTIASMEGVDDKLLTHLYQWKNEEKTPTFAQIEALSKKSAYPSWLFLP